MDIIKIFSQSRFESGFKNIIKIKHHMSIEYNILVHYEINSNFGVLDI